MHSMNKKAVVYTSNTIMCLSCNVLKLHDLTVVTTNVRNHATCIYLHRRLDTEADDDRQQGDAHNTQHHNTCFGKHPSTNQTHHQTNDIDESAVKKSPPPTIRQPYVAFSHQISCEQNTCTSNVRTYNNKK